MTAPLGDFLGAVVVFGYQLNLKNLSDPAAGDVHYTNDVLDALLNAIARARVVATTSCAVAGGTSWAPPAPHENPCRVPFGDHNQEKMIDVGVLLGIVFGNRNRRRAGRRCVENSGSVEKTW